MPIYEYKCRKNSHVFEVFQSISDKPLERCRVCEGPVDKLVSAGAFHLKGTGWYATDYKKKTNGSNATSEKKTEPEEKKVGEKKEEKQGSEEKKGSSEEKKENTKVKKASSTTKSD